MDAPWTWPVSVASALAKKRRAFLTVTPCVRAPASAREANGKQFVSAVAPARGPTERRSQAECPGMAPGSPQEHRHLPPAQAQGPRAGALTCCCACRATWGGSSSAVDRRPGSA